MTSQINSTSPFATGNDSVDFQKNNIAPEKIAGEFSIHTMQDDLLELQKRGEAIQGSGNINIQDFKKEITVPNPPQKTSNLNDISSEIVHPFSEKIMAPEKNKTEIVEIPTNNTANNNYGYFYKIIIGAAIVLFLAIFGLGGYYFWLKKNTKQPETITEPTPTQPITEESKPEPIIEPVVEKYSAKNPNYLTIDTNTLSSTAIKDLIKKLTQELKAEPTQAPYEFIVVDNNNNSIAFAIFAVAINLNLSSEVLSSLGEDFSVFFYNDNDNMRLALAINIVKPENIITALKKQEKTFITDASTLFLDEKPEITTGLFSESDYKNQKIRFFNTNKQIALSIDYSLLDKKLIITTSKNTMRIVLDKLITNSVNNIINIATPDSIEVAPIEKTLPLVNPAPNN
jgi:hypothetical protein